MTETRVDIYQYAIDRVLAGVRETIEVRNDSNAFHTAMNSTQQGDCPVCSADGIRSEITDEEVNVYYHNHYLPDRVPTDYWSNSFVQHQLSQYFRLARDEFGTTILHTHEGGYVTTSMVDEVIETVVANSTQRLIYIGTTSAVMGTCLEHVSKCDVCEELYGSLDVDWSFDSRICYQCHQSNQWCDWGEHWTTEAVDEVRGDWGCSQCLLDHDFAHCDNCDYWYREYDGNCDCDDYYGSSDSQNWTYVHSYNYKPDPIFLFDEQIDGDLMTSRSRVGKVFMGLEIEVEAKDASISDGVSIVRNELDSNEHYVYLKSDGSLNCGFEMVTHPATLAGHKKQNLEAFKSLAKIGFRGWKTQTCGIHVHVNRDAFDGVPHQWRWTRMFPTNQREFTILAGRNSERWASFEMMKEKLSYSFKHQRGRGDSRYEAINLCNWNTFEVRIFRSTLNTERILMIIELIDSTVEYTRHLTVRDIADHALEWSYYTAWVRSEQAETYPNLIAYLDKYSI